MSLQKRKNPVHEIRKGGRIKGKKIKGGREKDGMRKVKGTFICSFIHLRYCTDHISDIFLDVFQILSRLYKHC